MDVCKGEIGWTALCGEGCALCMWGGVAQGGNHRVCIDRGIGGGQCGRTHVHQQWPRADESMRRYRTGPGIIS